MNAPEKAPKRGIKKRSMKAIWRSNFDRLKEQEKERELQRVFEEGMQAFLEAAADEEDRLPIKPDHIKQASNMNFIVPRIWVTSRFNVIPANKKHTVMSKNRYNELIN